MENLDFGADELQRLQETDETLRGIKKLVEERGDPQFIRKSLTDIYTADRAQQRTKR